MFNFDVHTILLRGTAVHWRAAMELQVVIRTNFERIGPLLDLRMSGRPPKPASGLPRLVDAAVHAGVLADAEILLRHARDALLVAVRPAGVVLGPFQ